MQAAIVPDGNFKAGVQQCIGRRLARHEARGGLINDPRGLGQDGQRPAELLASGLLRDMLVFATNDNAAL